MESNFNLRNLVLNNSKKSIFYSAAQQEIFELLAKKYDLKPDEVAGFWAAIGKVLYEQMIDGKKGPEIIYIPRLGRFIPKENVTENKKRNNLGKSKKQI
jgi:hypothetical protein